jgi:cyclophilin family peptidyl-prolyl cis-trans isomerase
VTFPLEAPRAVAHIVDLVKRGFYDGQRVHRALPGFVVQFGDPQSRDLTQRDRWGRGPGAGSGRVIGLTEMTGKRKHGPGAVGLAHMGEPAEADSQLYITLDRRKDLDGRYAVIGEVVDGADVPGRLKVGDLIGRVYVAEK